LGWKENPAYEIKESIILNLIIHNETFAQVSTICYITIS